MRTGIETMKQWTNPYFDKETAYKYYNEFMCGKDILSQIIVSDKSSLLSYVEENAKELWDASMKLSGLR